MLEHDAHNDAVVGSTPTKPIIKKGHFMGISLQRNQRPIDVSRRGF